MNATRADYLLSLGVFLAMSAPVIVRALTVLARGHA
jgi:hypothetical protein